MSKKKDFAWQVTRDNDGKVNLAFGKQLSEAPYDDDTKLRVLGKALIQLGTQVMGSSVRDDDDDWDDEWNVDLFEEVEPLILAIAAEHGRRHHIHGADAADFAQELRLWVFENEGQVEEWLHSEDFDPKRGLKMLAASLRNECKDYGVDIKAQATGYDRSDVYFYSKGEVKALLPSVFDPSKWHEPPQSEGRSTKSQAEGGNWVATLADISRALKSLEPYDRDLLTGFHKDGWNNRMMAEAEDITESLMSHRHDRAVDRLVKVLGDTAPRPMRVQETKDPWRGRRAISTPAMRAYEAQAYDG